MFAHNRNLFSSLNLVFLDTTSIYFEGNGGEELGRLGHSKDHRPDLNQMVVAVVVDNRGTPICCEMWPGNTTDVKTTIPVVERIRKRFHVERFCLVADRGMIFDVQIHLQVIQVLKCFVGVTVPEVPFDAFDRFQCGLS